jgi:hypothetical protein
MKRIHLLSLILIFVFSGVVDVAAQEWMRINTQDRGTNWSFPYKAEHFSHFDFSDGGAQLRGHYVNDSDESCVVPFDVATLDSITFVSEPDSLKKREYMVFAMNITTVGGAPITSKEEYVDCYVSVDGRGEFDDYSGTARIRGRGNSTWLWYDKKPYRIKLDVKDKILGLKKNRDWVLLANYRDATDLMNTFGFETARWMGLPFTNHTRYVEVFLNGDYIGVYQLTEQIEVGGHRVDIDETNGVLLSFDLDDGPGLSPDATDNFYSEVYGMPMCVKNPDEVTPEQISTIKSDFAVLESAIKSKNYEIVDSLLDVESFVSMLQLQEYLYNVDFTAPRSLYMFRDVDGKYTMGPVWDWDAGYDFDWNQMETSHNFFASYEELIYGRDPYTQNGNYGLPRFFTDMFGSYEFMTLYKERWEERSDSIFVRNWNTIRKYYLQLQKGAYTRDSERWPIGKSTLTETNKMNKWLSNRKNYMDEVIASYPIPAYTKQCGSISTSLTLDYSKGYGQSVTVDVSAGEVAQLMGISISELTSGNIRILPLYRNGSVGVNRTNGVFGGWFNKNGDPEDWGVGHVYIEVFDDLFSWNCGLRADDGHCERGHSHTVTMQYQYTKNSLTLAVNVDVTFTIE